VPPLHAPESFLVQMFGPGVHEALATYRNAPKDPDLAGLLALFGSTEQIVHRFKRQGETMHGYDDKGREVVKVPITEPVQVLTAFDAKRGVAPANVT
jgi:nitrate reductase beta subunit